MGSSGHVLLMTMVTILLLSLSGCSYGVPLLHHNPSLSPAVAGRWPQKRTGSSSSTTSLELDDNTAAAAAAAGSAGHVAVVLGSRPDDAASSSSSSSSSWNNNNNASSSSSSSSSYDYETHFFTQTLDHFSFTPGSFRTFQQRYLLSTRHWGGPDPRAPIFVYCGNEGDITWFAENTGFLWEIAPHFKAMVVFPEHRYYGESVPDIAAEKQTAETLGYLTSTQALADYAGLIIDLKKNFSAQESPVVVFGGSYGGMLAAWFRLKYPHIAIGALAASAPILQFDDLVPWDGFYRIVSEDFKNASASCFNTIKSSWDALSAAYEESGGSETIKQKFNFCSNVSADLGSVQSFLYAAWVYMAMTDYPYPTNFLTPLPGNPVKTACEAMDSFPDGTDIISKIVAGANVYYNTTGQVQCFDFGGDPHGLNLWGWQACTEMVMPMTSNPDNSMFPPFNFSFEETIASCTQGNGVSPRPHWITQEFGGHDIYTVLKRFGSNIIFSNGLLDPWSNGGVLKSISSSVVALVTAQGAHHLDLRASTKDDPDWLVDQRREELKHISRWLRLYYADFRASRRHP